MLHLFSTVFESLKWLVSMVFQSVRAVAGRGPYVLILSPTRELALQIAAVMEEAGASSGLKTLCAYGGVPKPPQVRAPD